MPYFSSAWTRAQGEVDRRSGKVRSEADGSEEGPLTGPSGGDAETGGTGPFPPPSDVHRCGVKGDAKHVIRPFEVDVPPGLMQAGSEAASDGLGGRITHAPSKAVHTNTDLAFEGPCSNVNGRNHGFVRGPRHHAPLVEHRVDARR